MKSVVLAVLTALALPLAASAQSFATKPLTLIVTFPAGGFADSLGRTIARELSATLGQPVIVNNLAGANGSVGMAALARAPADGHTLAYSTMSPLALQPVLQKDAPLRPGSVQPLCGVVENAMAVVVKATAPQRSVADLLTACTPGRWPELWHLWRQFRACAGHGRTGAPEGCALRARAVQG